MSYSKVPAAAPADDPINKMVKVAATGARFNTVASAIAIQFFSLCGTASFFSIQAEMRDPKQYGKSLLMGQTLVMFNYIVLAIMIYSKVGQYVASPALGSAGELFKRLPTVLHFLDCFGPLSSPLTLQLNMPLFES